MCKYNAFSDQRRSDKPRSFRGNCKAKQVFEPGVDFRSVLLYLSVCRLGCRRSILELAITRWPRQIKGRLSVNFNTVTRIDYPRISCIAIISVDYVNSILFFRLSNQLLQALFGEEPFLGITVFNYLRLVWLRCYDPNRLVKTVSTREYSPVTCIYSHCTPYVRIPTCLSLCFVFIE